MEEKELKTSVKQRVTIGAIAVILLGSIIAGYAAVILNNGSSNSSTQNSIDPEKLARYQQEYADKQAAFEEATKADFEKFAPYRSEVVAYNETTANESGLQTRDLLVGDGRELAEGDTNYLAYYIGWCADESIFDSSMNSTTEPTAFSRVLDPSMGLIEGWESGIVGMKLGGIREMTIPGELAYKDSTQICGGEYKPLKFLVMAVPNEEPLKTLALELETASAKVQYAQYGFDYEEMVQEISTESESEATSESAPEAETATPSESEPAPDSEGAAGDASATESSPEGDAASSDSAEASAPENTGE